MHDQQHARAPSHYEDTIVVDVDVPDRPDAFIPPRPRTATAELTMQVHVNGEWHRRVPDLSTTSCDKPIHSQFDSVRRESLIGKLCRVCFTPHELRLSVKANHNEGNLP